jgi:signal transduction histidine kinase
MLVVLREALSNAARHAAASRVDVTVQAGPDLVLVVRDNGVGLRKSARRSGLANLEERAILLGGTFSAAPAGDAGTELRWQVPLGKAARSPG